MSETAHRCQASLLSLYEEKFTIGNAPKVKNEFLIEPSARSGEKPLNRLYMSAI